MRKMRRLAAIGVAVCADGGRPRDRHPGMAQSRAHVYLLARADEHFLAGMDTLAEKIQHRGIYATVHNYSEWQSLADHAAAAYHAGTEGPIIIIGHSLGADAVMEMSAYLGRKGVPVALAVPFDGTQSFATPSNVARVLNLTECRLRPRVSRGRLPRLDLQRRREQRSQHRPSQHRQVGAAARPSDRRHSRRRRQRQREARARARGE